MIIPAFKFLFHNFLDTFYVDLLMIINVDRWDQITFGRFSKTNLLEMKGKEKTHTSVVFNMRNNEIEYIT